MLVDTVLPVVLTVSAFLLGLGVGYLWWGRQFVRARLTRDEALSIMRSEVERAGGVGQPPWRGPDRDR